jgi:hypothetical protein
MFMKEYLTEKQKEAWQFFQDNLEKLAADPLYKLKYVVIYENAVVGLYDTFETAFVEALSKYRQGDFIIQQVVTDKEIVGFLFSAVA